MIKRYHPYLGPDKCEFPLDGGWQMKESENGAWVRWEDVRRELDDGECFSCVDGQCTAGPHCVACPINQCDGCRRGLPVLHGKHGGMYHDLSGTVGAYPGEVMACTAHLYGHR